MYAYKSFGEFHQRKTQEKFHNKVDTMCETLAFSGVSFNEFWLKVGMPVLLEGYYTNEEELMERWGQKFAEGLGIEVVLLEQDDNPFAGMGAGSQANQYIQQAQAKRAKAQQPGIWDKMKQGASNWWNKPKQLSGTDIHQRGQEAHGANWADQQDAANAPAFANAPTTNVPLAPGADPAQAQGRGTMGAPPDKGGVDITKPNGGSPAAQAGAPADPRVEQARQAAIKPVRDAFQTALTDFVKRMGTSFGNKNNHHMAKIAEIMNDKGFAQNMMKSFDNFAQVIKAKAGKPSYYNTFQQAREKHNVGLGQTGERLGDYAKHGEIHDVDGVPNTHDQEVDTTQGSAQTPKTATKNVRPLRVIPQDSPPQAQKPRRQFPDPAISGAQFRRPVGGKGLLQRAAMRSK